MSIQSKPYYWVTCDFPDETGTCDSNAQEGSDYSAWAEEGAAVDQAIGDGTFLESPDGSKHYCDGHPRITQEELDDGKPTPAPPYLLVNNDDEALLVEGGS